MTRNYDPLLKYFIPSNNGNNGMILNKSFNQWSDNIEENLVGRSCDNEEETEWRSENYGGAFDNGLFSACLEHAREHQRPSK
jgi:hypothetical protein